MSRPTKRDNARRVIEDRLQAIEVAMQDLRATDIGGVDAATLDTDRALQERYANRIKTVAFHLTHLQDDAKRLAMAGAAVAALDKVVHSSLPLRVVANLTDSARHGEGGSKKSATTLEGFLIADRGRRGATGVAVKVPFVSMNIVDAQEGTFASRTILDSAIHHWGQILHSAFGISPTWADRASAAKSGRFAIGDLGKLARATPAASRRVRRYRIRFYPKRDTQSLLATAVLLVVAAFVVATLIWMLVTAPPSEKELDRVRADHQPKPVRTW
jgi:hypothetical protein